jgi:hypothetical protein
MSSPRYSLLGLARPRAAWFTELGRWSTAGALPVDFVRCVSAAEVRARLASDRPFSALLVDSSVSGFDRDLVDVARSRGCVTLVIADGGDRDWGAIGAAAALGTPLERQALLDALEQHATSLAEVLPHPGAASPAAPEGWRGRLVVLTGPGGSGASVLAMSLAQALGDDARNAGHVVLADLALHADQGMFHGSPDVVPGVSELVEAHRTGHPDAAAVRANTFDVAGRGYQLLLGLRRRRHWAALRPRAVEATVTGLLQTYRHVVADVEADVEGDRECGSIEVEERNALARTAIARADAVVVVGLPGIKGLHALLRCLADLVDYGVAPARLVPVINRAPRSPRSRAELAQAFAALASGFVDPATLPSPVPVPAQRRWEEALRDGVRLPDGPGRILLGAVDAVVARAPLGGRPADQPARVQPGSLGTFWDDRAAS